MNPLNLNEFLDIHQKNIIMIMYNQDYFTQIFDNQVDFAPLKGKWLFMEHKDNSNRFISPQEFILNNEKFNITDFHEIIEHAELKWKKLMPHIPFPDIQISANKDRSAYLSYDKQNFRHIIFLGINELDSLEKFNFTIGHELGHLYYFTSGLEEKVNTRLKQKQFKDFVPWLFLAIATSNISLNIYIIYQSINFLINVLSLLQIAFWALFLGANLFSVKRLENYSMEFFSDFFSVSFSGKPSNKDYGLSGGGYHGYSHPAGNLRISIIKNTLPDSLISEWENPVEKYSHKFKSINYYEMICIVSNCTDQIKRKIINSFKKHRKEK